MAGEIEEPFGLNFQVDSLHSGSISFGRFENEALCWERRSSFSHNRYLEEVVKCSKPGSVTEKKAYFEAHFRRKGFLGSPNETDYQTSENNIDHMKNAETHAARFDHSLDGLVLEGDRELTECETEVIGTSVSELRLSDGTNNVACIPEHVKVDKADDSELGNLLSINSESGIKMKENIDGEKTSLDISLVPKEKVSSKPEYIKPRLIPRVSAGQSSKCISSNASNGSEKKLNKTVKNDLVRSKAEENISEGRKKCLMQKTPKYERASQTKGVDEMNSAGKESRNRTITEPWFCRSQEVSNRLNQSTNRVKPNVGANKPHMRQDSSVLGFKSNELVERKKEATASKIEPEKPQTRSSTHGTRLSKCSLSPKAGINQDILIEAPTKTGDYHRPSQAGITSLVSQNKRLLKGKCLSLREHKVSEDNELIHKAGKTFDGKQKTRTRRNEQLLVVQK